MTRSGFKPEVGDFVRAVIPAEAQKAGQFAYGRVSAIETFKDDHGKRTWIYVRWINVDGKPDGADQKHTAEELEPYE